MKNFENEQFGLGVENNRIYIGHFEQKEKDRVFVPDSSDMTSACLSIVSLYLKNECKNKNSSISAISVNGIGTLQFWTSTLVSKFIDEFKEDDKK